VVNFAYILMAQLGVAHCPRMATKPISQVSATIAISQLVSGGARRRRITAQHYGRLKRQAFQNDAAFRR
jgi:hypothetical protein